MKKLFTLFICLCLVSQAFTQILQPSAHSLKGNGLVFYQETFDWGDPTDPSGWKQPAGFTQEDPNDTGYRWQWWPNDSVVDSKYTREPPMRSTTADNGSLCLFLSKYNEFLDPRIDVNNSIVFPPFDCSAHGTVVVSYETCFMCYEDNNTWEMLLEISTDNWLHSAKYDVSFGVNHKGRPDKTLPGKPAIFQANISDVAAGQTDVRMKITWKDANLYFWQIDDFKLSEAWDNDLQLKFAQMEWNDGNDNTAMTPAFMMPKSQLAGNSYTNFKAGALNFGEFDQSDTYFEVDITKNSQNVFHAEGPKRTLYTLITDTTTITDSYTPNEFGHYKVTYNYKSKETDDTPENNSKSVYFNVTDSIYSHADGTAEEGCNWGIEAYHSDNTPLVNHAVGVKYHIYNDAEVNSISAFIAGGLADGKVDFRFVLYYVPVGEEDETPVEMLGSDVLTYDSTMIGTWITMPMTKDGESEFYTAGDLVYAVVEYSNAHTEYLLQRYEDFKIGTDYSFKILDPVGVAKGTDQAWATTGFISERNLLVRLNINDHSNINDGVDLARSTATVGQNYPNPFSRTTNISYELVNNSDVSISVMDLTGRVVMDINQGYQASGMHHIQLDASGLDAGIYLYTLKAGGFTETRRMTVSK